MTFHDNGKLLNLERVITLEADIEHCLPIGVRVMSPSLWHPRNPAKTGQICITLWSSQLSAAETVDHLAVFVSRDRGLGYGTSRLGYGTTTLGTAVNVSHYVSPTRLTNLDTLL
jgi:hypothetical protein